LTKKKNYQIDIDLQDPTILTDNTRELGLVVVRGTSIMLICAEDGMEEIGTRDELNYIHLFIFPTSCSQSLLAAGIINGRPLLYFGETCDRIFFLNKKKIYFAHDLACPRRSNSSCFLFPWFFLLTDESGLLPAPLNKDSKSAGRRSG